MQSAPIANAMAALAGKPSLPLPINTMRSVNPLD